MPSLPADYQYDGNDAFTGDPSDPANVGEFRHEERITTLETNDAVQDTDIDDLEAATTPYNCRVYINSAESIAGGTDTEIPWDAESFDNGGFWSSGTDLVVPSGAAGTYIIVGQVQWDTNTTNKRTIQIEVNGTDVAETSVNIDQANETMQVSCIYPLVATDTVALEVLQTSGASRTVLANTTWLSIARISE